MERFNETYRLWQPMKYATAKKKEVLDAALVSDEYGIELKVDGSSYVWSKDLDGSVHLYGDKISKKTGDVIDKIAAVATDPYDCPINDVVIIRVYPEL